MTVARIPLAGGIAAAYLAGSSLLGVLALVAFVLLDIYDGEVARTVGPERPGRRLLDGTIDRISVHVMTGLVSFHVEGVAVVWLALLARDLTQAAVGGRVLWKSRVIVAGATWHRVYTGSIAAWGAAVLMTSSPFWALVPLVLVTGLITLVDYCGRAGGAARALETSAGGRR